MGRYAGWLGVLVYVLWVGVSEAGLFCVVDFAGKRCQYNDLDTCRQAAGPNGGCVLNEAEIAKPFGPAPYCLVESFRTECVYQDMESCEKRATSTRTVCMANPNTNPMMGGGGMQPFGAQPQGAGMPSMPSMPQQPRMPAIPGAPAGFPGSGATAPNLPSSGGVGAGYAPGAGYWPGVDKK